MRFLVWILLLVNILSIKAQDITKLDSLKQQLEVVKIDSVKFDLYLGIYQEYKSSEPDSAIKYVKRALSIAEQTHNLKYLTLLNNRLGTLHASLGENNKALNYYKNSFKYELEKLDKNPEQDSIGLAGSYLNIGTAYQNMGDYAQSLDYFFKALEVFKNANDEQRVIYCYINLGITYNIIAENETSLKYYLLAHDISKKLKDDYTLGYIYLNLGILYDDLEEPEKALENYNQLLKLLKGSDNYSSLGNAYNNIACVYEDMQQYDKAIEYYENAQKVWSEHRNKAGEAGIFSNLAGVYTQQGKYEIAETYFLKSIKIREELVLPHPLASSYLGIGQLYIEMKEYNKAESFLKKSHNILDTLMVVEDLVRNTLEFSNLYNLTGEYKKAYKYHKIHKELSDSLSNEKSIKKITQMQMQYEFNKKMEIKDIEDQKKELEHKTEINEKEFENKRQRIIIYAVIGLFLILLVFAFVVLKQNKEKKKANILLSEQKEQISEINEELNQQAEELQLLNESLHQQNEEVLAQRDEIEAQRDEIEAQRDNVEEQKGIIEEIHREVSQSIDYATRLQQSILPETKILKKHLSDHFVFFKPKDKVSGDFFWWTHIENHTVITAADCTGHGVPGAFMSMLGVSYLREIVQKEYVTHPGVILRKIRKEIIKSLKQKGESGEQKDGMDMALISINHETNILQYAGANNPLYIISNRKIEGLQAKEGLSENSLKLFYEIKPDKMPIAIYERMDKFKTHEIQLEQGDLLYMFSDGYPDQFGGPKGKKFKYKPFKRLLLENIDHTMHEQKEALDLAFKQWKGDQEQVDDVVVLGIKI